MTAPTRRALFLGSVLLFLLALMPLLFYTVGFRFSVNDFSWRPTGGIFVHTNPTGVAMQIGTVQKTSSFISGNVFVQNLQPDVYAVKATKQGYYSWEKTVPVEAHQVTELHPLLIEKELQRIEILESSYTTVLFIPNALLAVVMKESATSTAVRFFDISTRQFLPYENTLSETRAHSLSTAMPIDWSQQYDLGFAYTARDIFLITRTPQNTMRVQSFWMAGALGTRLKEKPRRIIPHPERSAVFYVLHNTTLSRWDASRQSFETLLETIDAIATDENGIIVWDAQNSQLYKTGWNLEEARPLATSTMPAFKQVSIRTRGEESYVVSSAEGLWFFPPPSEKSPRNLTNSLVHPENVVITPFYILWWDSTSITLRWIMEESELPSFQKTLQETIYTGGTIQAVAPYPEEHYLIVQEKNIIYALELDGRGGVRNKMPLYHGKNPSFSLDPTNNTLIIFDDGTLLAVDL